MFFDEFSLKSGGELMTATMRSSISQLNFSQLNAQFTPHEKHHPSVSYSQKFLNGKIQSSFSNSNEKSIKSRASISELKVKSSSGSKSGSRRTHRSSDDEEESNEDSIISVNKYYEIFNDSNPVPHLFKLLKVHFRIAKPSKTFI